MVKNIIVLLISLVFLGCSKTAVREDSRISTAYVKGYREVTFDYTRRVKKVRVEGIPMESGNTYYIEDGEYLLTYEYIPTMTFAMEMSYKREESNSGDNNYTGIIRERKTITIKGDDTIKIEAKFFEVNFQGEAGN